MGSGPYVITTYDAGRSVQLTRNENYWGADLPLRRGTNNFDQITLDFYGDSTAQDEAFKAGQVYAQREFNAERWNSRYDFPRALAGDVVKTEIPHKKPSGMTGFVMNSRRAPFDDWRVREALIQAFNFEFSAPFSFEFRPCWCEPATNERGALTSAPFFPSGSRNCISQACWA